MRKRLLGLGAVLSFAVIGWPCPERLVLGQRYGR